MHYLRFLSEIHQLRAPQAYLEIGIRNGNSLALARCPAVGIDPAYHITAELNGPVSLHRTSSDEYFARPDPLSPVGGQPFELAFIDGLHLFEFALRDFINAERHSAPTGIIVFDDVLPRTVDEAARLRHTRGWTGDVYSVVQVLARYRPELFVLPVGTWPTGLLVVVGLDPANTVLSDRFSEILLEFRRPDPQPVPPSLMDRLAVVAPERVLRAGVIELLAGGADNGTSMQQRLKDVVARKLGPAFVAGAAS